VSLFHCQIFPDFAFPLLYLKLPYYFLVFFLFIFILFSINSSTSFFRMNSSGWKSFSILSTIAISSRFTNLLNSDRSEFVVFLILSRVSFISWLSFFISFISSSTSVLEEIKFFPKRRTRSRISLFRSSRSRSLVLKSDRRNFIWLSWDWSAMFIESARSL